MKRALSIIVVAIALVSTGIVCQTTARADGVTLSYGQDVIHCDGCIALFGTYAGLFDIKPLRAVVGTWRVADNEEGGDNMAAGVEIDILDAGFKFRVGVLGVSDRDKFIQRNLGASIVIGYCWFEDRGCTLLRHISSPAASDLGMNFATIAFQARF